jgi:hypothetical protein
MMHISMPNKHKHVRQLKQSVQITGLGSPTFEDFQHILDATTQVFRAKLGEVDTLAMSKALYGGELVIDSSCWYFTDRQSAPSLKNIPFMEGVDPMHHLEQAQGSNFVHTKDNKVEYPQKIYTNGRAM